MCKASADQLADNKLTTLTYELAYAPSWNLQRFAIAIGPAEVLPAVDINNMGQVEWVAAQAQARIKSRPAARRSGV